jgi:hypothetical protein
MGISGGQVTLPCLLGGEKQTMQSRRDHRIRLNRILRDERIAPNRALLAEMLYLYLDAEEGPEKTLIQQTLEVNFNNAKLIKWKDGQDPVVEVSMTDVQKAATAKIRDIWKEMEEQGAAVVQD